MPVLKHAKKKLRQDKKRTVANETVKDTYKELLKVAKTKKTDEAIRKAFSGLDKAAKKHIIHANKAARLKSSLTKLVSGGKPQTAKSQSTSPSPKSPKRTVKKKSSSKMRSKK